MTTIPAEEIKNFFILVSVKLDFYENLDQQLIHQES